MKHLNIILALANRQLLENRPIFALALICGLATLALPFVIGTSTTTANQREFLENIRGGAQVLGMVVSYGVAFYLGISLFGRELSEKRMGFFFSRPISTNALWIGKLLGAWLLIASSLLLVWLPAILIGGLSFLFQEKISWPVILFVTGALPFLFCLGLTASIAFRSKSWWLTVDLVSLMVAVLLVLFGVDRLEREGALRPLIFGSLFLSVVAITGMLVASRISLGQGRTSLRSVHRVMSLCLWSIVFLGVGLFDGYTRWVVAVTPDDFTQLRNASPVSNDWLLIDGSVRYRPDYFPALLHNPVTGQFVRIGDLDTEFSLPSISPDGQYAAWVHIPIYRSSTPNVDRNSGNLVVCRLEGTIPKPKTTSLIYDLKTHFVFSPDGKSLAAITPDRVELIQLQTQRVVNQFPLPYELHQNRFSHLLRAVFPSLGVLRLYRTGDLNDEMLVQLRQRNRVFAYKVQIVEIGIENQTIKQTGVMGVPFDQTICYSPQNDQISYYSLPDPDTHKVTLQVVNGQTGTHLFPLPEVYQNAQTFVLADGRYLQALPLYQTIITDSETGYRFSYFPRVQFELFASNGERLRSFSLNLDEQEPAPNSFYFCAEPAPGRVLVLNSRDYEQSQLFEINCDTGQIVMKAEYNFEVAPAYPDNHQGYMDKYIASSLKTCLLKEEVYSSRRLPHITFHAFDGMTGTTRSFYHLPEYRKGPTYD